MTKPATAETDIRHVPIAHLVLAPENVRKTSPDAAEQKQLEASIRAHGLLENLVARPDAKKGRTQKYAVVAGGRRLLAIQALVDAGDLPKNHAVPCKIAADADGAELSLAENAVRIAMHPADQVVAFAALEATGSTVASIAARFGVSERTVERRLSMGKAAPAVLDAYRADKIDLATLQAFTVTTDHTRQLAVLEQVDGQGYRPTSWQVKRALTENRVPGNASIARYVGADEYEAAGGTISRDLFAEHDQTGSWFEDPALLQQLAHAKLQAAADELATRWKWAIPTVEVQWQDTARYGRVHPVAADPTPDEETEIQRLRDRAEELANINEEDWTDDLDREAESIEPRLEAIDAQINARAVFRPQDIAIAGCIATIASDGTLEVIQGLVRPEDVPAKHDPATVANGADTNPAANPATDASTPVATVPASNVEPPAMTHPVAAPVDPSAKARSDAGVGIGLADDLRAVRNALVKAHLAKNFKAAFDLVVFQVCRTVFCVTYKPTALDITTKQTADRPYLRAADDNFADWSPGEAMLEDRSHLSLDWMEIQDDAESFAALCALSARKKQALFAAAIALTVKGQLAFEHEARPEIEATVARLDIDFAKHVRPIADLYWSRIKKGRILEIARETLGAAWASARSKLKKPDLAAAMEEAFAAGDTPLGITAAIHADALKWTMPGFAAFDTATPDDTADASTADPDSAAVATTDADTAGADTANNEAPAADTSATQPDAVDPDDPTANGHDPEAPPPVANGEDLPAFLQAVH